MPLPVLVAASGASWESGLVSGLDRQRGPLAVVRRCVDIADLLAAAATGQAVAALLAADLPHLDADVVATLLEQNVVPVGITTPGSSDEALRLRRIGVAVQVDVDRLDEIAPAVVAAHTAARSPERPCHGSADGAVNREAPAGDGRLIAVWGPAGAPGRSTVAAGLASELSALGRSTLLVDADVYGGSLAQMLGMLDESSGLLAAARNANEGRLDATTLAGHARRLSAGLSVLTGLPRADRWPELRPAAVTGVLSAARSLAACTVLDVGFCLEHDDELGFDSAPRRNGATLRCLEEADLVVAVGSPDPVGLARLTRGLVDLLDAVPGAQISTVVNRMRTSLAWSQTEVAETLTRFTGLSRVSFLPADPQACDRAAVHGRLLREVAPDSRLRRGLHELAAELAGAPDLRSRGRRRSTVRARRQTRHLGSPV
jgi:MinD-like ATPase involved in chromosome partitioning or flagellar assembly